MSNCESCWHLATLHDENGCHADRLSFRGGREEYCSCTEPPAARADSYAVHSFAHPTKGQPGCFWCEQELVTQ